ncbi:MAG: trehalase-like domain-containing protein, partial [Candidatus Margulisiibacteriota bacterium]
MYKDLEDYGIIGNLETCALVGKDGSIDWLCFPFIDSPSVFAALLDTERGGHFRIGPSTEYESIQSYIKKTNILQTTFSTALGNGVLTDFMKEKGGDHHRAVFRKVLCTKGSLDLEICFKPRFQYAKVLPKLFSQGNGILAQAENEKLFLETPFPLEINHNQVRSTLVMKKGQAFWFILQYGAQDPLTPQECEKKLMNAGKYWTGWRDRSNPLSSSIEEPWHDLVVRSGLVLKLLIDTDTGAIAAAPTTSLPEKIGGVRNWDYRYSWIRDASFTVQALYHLGHVKESKQFYQWIENIVQQAENPSKILIMYPLNKGTSLEEKNLENLSGYKDSSPVRIGNDAARQ